MKEINKIFFKHLTHDQIDEYMVEQLTELKLDYRANLTDVEMSHIIKKMVYLFETKYKEWSLFDFKHAVDEGKSNGKSFRLTVVTLEEWFFKYSFDFINKHIREQINENNKLKNAELDVIKKAKDPDCADVIMWRLNKLIDNRMTNAQKWKVKSFSFDEILTHVKNNTLSMLDNIVINS